MTLSFTLRSLIENGAPMFANFKELIGKSAVRKLRVVNSIPS
jgi:hypothetical protein